MFLFNSALAEETAAETTSFLGEVLARFSDLGATGWITIFTMVVLGAIVIGMSVSRKTWNAKSLAFAALSIALSFILSYIKIFRMPNSGSVTLASMLPVILISYRQQAVSLKILNEVVVNVVFRKVVPFD